MATEDKGYDYEKQHIDEEDNSPYEIVRAAVSNKDDPTLPVMTFRFWVLGFIFTCALSFVNQFFYYRTTPLTVGILTVQLVTFPLGKLMARVLPKGILNPGPFNIKEHVLITAMANAAAGTAYAVDIVTIKRIWYKQDIGFLGSFLLVFTTQCLGYGMAGICRRFLVRPAAMIWPANLVNISVFRTLHEESEDSKGISRLKFFLIVSCCSFVYYFLPGFLASFLTCISILCYIAPNNTLVNIIGSGSKGLGVLSFSLDWNTITSFLGSPLVTPFWAEINNQIGYVAICWILIPIGYFTNTWSAKSYTLLSTTVYQTNGDEYDPLQVLKPNGGGLDLQAYETYGPIRLSYFFAVGYGVGFATLSALLVHTALYHGGEIMSRFREARSQDDDIHAKLMDRYPEVPDWWYGGFFILNLALAIFVCEYYGIDLPWWAVLLATLIAAIFVLPAGIITAIANTTPGLNILTEFVIGYLLPGYPIANVTFKTYGYIAMAQAITFVGDLKLGHYMKIPPKAMFIAQSVGTVIAGLINLSTAYWLFTTPGFCNPQVDPKFKDTVWTCPNTKVFYSASIIWGVIGPARMFGPGAYYNSLMWWFVIGAVLPIPMWLLARRYPNSFWQYGHVPIILSATAVMPPATPVMYNSWIILGFIFQFYLFRYRNIWWSKYNYILSAGMDTGVALCGLLLFFAFQSPGITLKWWGTQNDCPNWAG
jgi:OPT family small oligopeptide transporter